MSRAIATVATTGTVTSPPSPDPTSPSASSDLSSQAQILSADSLPSNRFTVKPSSLLKSPVVRRTKRLTSGHYQDRLTHLSATNYRAHRQRTFRLSQKNRVSAEDVCLQKEQLETFILMRAAERNLQWNALDGQFAIALARAVKGTLEAEEELIRRRIIEAENLLATLRDTLDEARGRVIDASYQYGAVVSTFDRNGIEINQACDLFTPPPLQVLETLSSWDYGSFGMGSVSDVESGVDDDVDTDNSDTQSN